MRLIYLTSKTFPSTKVEPFIIKSMAQEFGEILKQDFTLFIRGRVPSEFGNINTGSISLPNRFKALLYFVVLPFVIRKNGWSNNDVIIFSSDPYLLAILVFWREVFGFRYKICSEWHQLFDDWRDRYVSTNSDYVVSTSKRLRSFLTQVSGKSEDRILVPYGGVNQVVLEQADTSKGEIRSKFNLPEGKFLVGYAGAYRAMKNVEKGISTMIKALPYLDSNTEMVFVGGMPKEIEEYSKLAEEEGVLDRCIFVGKQPYRQLTEYEKAMDILVIANPDTPYYRNYCFPFKVWEYMGSARPIVYSNLEIIDEILKDRGSSFQVGDPVSLANTIASVKENIESAEKVAKGNPAIARSYTWHNRARQILDFINK